MRITQGAAITIGALLVVVSACSSTSGPAAEFAAARQRWNERGPTSYVVTVRRSCECLPEAAGPVAVTVRAGAVQSRVYTASGNAVSAQFQELFPTVDGLFALIESARRQKVHQLIVEYDDAMGYPVRVSIDFDRNHVDDEVSYYASDLHE